MSLSMGKNIMGNLYWLIFFDGTSQKNGRLVRWDDFQSRGIHSRAPHGEWRRNTRTSRTRARNVCPNLLIVAGTANLIRDAIGRSVEAHTVVNPCKPKKNPFPICPSLPGEIHGLWLGHIIARWGGSSHGSRNVTGKPRPLYFFDTLPGA